MRQYAVVLVHVGCARDFIARSRRRGPPTRQRLQRPTHYMTVRSHASTPRARAGVFVDVAGRDISSYVEEALGKSSLLGGAWPPGGW
jgi:hypothetical protein